MENSKEIDPIESFLQIVVEMVSPVVVQKSCHDAAVPSTTRYECSARITLGNWQFSEKASCRRFWGFVTVDWREEGELHMFARSIPAWQTSAWQSSQPRRSPMPWGRL